MVEETQITDPTSTNVVKLRDSKSAKRKQRVALHSLLSNEEEYANMDDHIIIDDAISDSIDHDVASEASLTGIADVMKLVYLDVQGYGLTALATQMGMSKEDVQAIRKTEAFKSARGAVMAEIISMSRNMIQVTTMKAVKTLTECMDSKNEKIKLSAAVEVLDRAGLNTTQKIELTANTSNMAALTDEQLEEIMRSSNAIPGTAEVIPDGNK